MHIYSIQGLCVWSCIAMSWTLWKPQWVEDTNFLYMDITISKRGITLPNLTKQMSCTFILHIYQVYQLSCGCLYNWDKTYETENGNVYTICHLFSRCRRGTWTESGIQTFKLDITKRTSFNDDHYILCTLVCTCYHVHPLYMVDFIHLDNFN